MKQEIIDVLQEHNKAVFGDKKYYLPITDKESAWEYLSEEGKEVTQLNRESHRWWDEFIQVKRFDFPENTQREPVYIGYHHAHANRDESMADLGFEADNSLTNFYTPVEKTITDYIITDSL